VKVALIRRNFSTSGGAELYLQRLLGALQQGGHEVHLFAQNWEAAAGITFHQVHAAGSRAAAPRVFAEAVQAKLAEGSWDCVFSLERTIAQDVYRAGDGVHAVWLEQRRKHAPAWRKPFIGWGGFHRTMRELERETFSLRATRRVIVNSEMVRKEIVERFNYPDERIHLVRNGIELPRFASVDRAAARSRFGFGERDCVILFVGSGWERKGLSFALEAFGRFRSSARDAKMLVVGKGNPPFHVSGVTYAGVLREVEVAYAASDLFLFPPIYEPSANVCFEALAAGLPVITSSSNGAAEVLEEGVNGSVIRDPRDITTIVERLAYWAGRKQRVRAGCDLSLERNVAQTVQVLELAAAERRNANAK